MIRLIFNPMVTIYFLWTKQKIIKVISTRFFIESNRFLLVASNEENNVMLHVQSPLNGSATDNEKMLFDLDPNAPTTPQPAEENHQNLFDIDEPTVDFTSFENPAFQKKMSPLNSVEQVAEELVTKVDLNSLPAAPPVAETTETPSTNEPPKKPTSAGATKPTTTTTTTTKPKAASTKPTSASASTTKSTETKPNLASRKTIHSAPVKPKPLATPTSPTQDASKPTTVRFTWGLFSFYLVSSF